MARHEHTSQLRVLPKIWVLRLLGQFLAELWQINAQLTLPPVPGRPFVLGKWPDPLVKQRAPRTFEQALRLGRDPNNTPFLEPEIKDQYYNLFLRVAQHVLGSEDWLLMPLRPYLGQHLPSVTYSSSLVNHLLKRLHLRRMSANATAFALKTAPEQVARQEQAALQAIAARPAPIHLLLLIALFHERQWHFPSAPETRELDMACCVACRNFTERSEFTWSEEARALNTEISHALWSIIIDIRHHGHHSERPNYPQTDLLDPAPPGEVQLGILNSRRCLFYEPFDRFADADFCAGLGYGTPISHFIYGEPTSYSENSIPTKEESRLAVRDLLTAADFPSERWQRYDPAPPSGPEFGDQKKAVSEKRAPANKESTKTIRLRQRRVA